MLSDNILTSKERKRIVDDIINMQVQLWIPLHRDSKEYIENMTDSILFKYYQMHMTLKNERN